jgi:IS30 family transposase
VQNHCRDLRHGYDHLLHYLRAAQVVIASKSASFRRCYGGEFAYHEQIAHELTAEGFFAHPYHSWERGLNENTNGLIRQYIPKRKDIDDLSHEEVAKIMEKINDRPRKCLGFKTPNQLFLGHHQPVALAS